MAWRSDGHGSPREPWLPCEMHGITYRDCWGCNKPRELCSFGYCGRPATHIGAGRPCCESDARVLADLNGDGTVTPIPYLADLNTDSKEIA